MSTDPDRRTHFFIRPNVVERTFSRLFGFLVGTLGLGLSHHYLLEVRGRRSGRLYSTPVNLLARISQIITSESDSDARFDYERQGSAELGRRGGWATRRVRR